MSLGLNPADVNADMEVARRAIAAGVWFHSSPTYRSGFTYMVLRMAFDEDRSRIPRLILKVRDGSVALMRFEVEDSCRRLGVDGIDIAQLVSMDPRPGNLVDQLRAGKGVLVDELASLRDRGLVRGAVLFITRENADAAVEAAGSDLIDGVTLYWNALQRDCTDAAWERIRRQSIPVLALRTLGGGSADKAAAEKAVALQELIQRAGCRDATEFNLRLMAAEPCIRTTIGGTASLNHLEGYLAAALHPEPLDAAIVSQVDALRA